MNKQNIEGVQKWKTAYLKRLIESKMFSHVNYLLYSRARDKSGREWIFWTVLRPPRGAQCNHRFYKGDNYLSSNIVFLCQPWIQARHGLRLKKKCFFAPCNYQRRDKPFSIYECGNSYLLCWNYVDLAQDSSYGVFKIKCGRPQIWGIQGGSNSVFISDGSAGVGR